ncbi:hypothetical protein K0B96_02635 [Horticoccus luteus]|uniref:Alpha-L-rhamnosidase six-hairpin glycosidase domain-containing protein n=1 Tax=Horticoccus luteus TaxID=2862869 RepID=A0A8F9TXU8_9BACT|nr:hypothetical protein [Horticoccus luteus]QYM79532.1 hypothetical protein K0B96_02635 [Horticoccus luteus]
MNEDAQVLSAALTAAVRKNLEPAATERAYQGHFTIVADGHWFGAENTWPGLDSWQMAGAYLSLGRTQLVTDYFAYVRASQRADGNIPFAIFATEPPPEHLATYLKGLRLTEDAFTYPVKGGGGERTWVGLFSHWIAGINPLGALGATCYLLMADEIFATTGDLAWLARNLASITAAGNYLSTRRSENGLIAGAGFYVEMPPRHQWDGVAQCYIVRAWRGLARLCEAAGRGDEARRWRAEAEALAGRFREVFWRGDHFAEYVHPVRGVVDEHGLSDVNWAAVAWDVATPEQADALWPRLMAEESFWHGDMPTQTVSKPFVYQEWEFYQSHEDVGFKPAVGPLYDVAAMGRVWFLEALACLRRGETKRVREGALRVARAGLKNDGYWQERYHPLQINEVHACGPKGYCEYAAVFTRVVLGNRGLFGDVTLA